MISFCDVKYGVILRGSNGRPAGWYRMPFNSPIIPNLIESWIQIIQYTIINSCVIIENNAGINKIIGLTSNPTCSWSLLPYVWCVVWWRAPSCSVETISYIRFYFWEQILILISIKYAMNSLFFNKLFYSKLLSISGLLKSNSLVLPLISNTRGEIQKSQRRRY